MFSPSRARLARDRRVLGLATGYVGAAAALSVMCCAAGDRRGDRVRLLDAVVGSPRRRGAG